mmetsp:Transcript_17959/g.25159  ORF Transcript_17959/g.25159 Transcript_17959/m.25159 type:complete len:290 (+) Transcript_17959:2-871(+)
MVSGAAAFLPQVVAFTTPLSAYARKKIPLSEFEVSDNFEWRGETHTGLRFYDIKEGKGSQLKAGQQVSVHYDCSYRSIVAVSTRQAVVLSQNRYIERPYSYKYGTIPSVLQDPLEYKDSTGVGARVDPDPIYTQKLFVTKIYKGSAADESKLKVFDEILLVDGKSVDGLSKQEVNKLLEGESGDVTITVERNVGRYERGQEEIKISKRPYRKLLSKSVKKGPEKAGGLYSGEDLAPPPEVIFVPEALKGMKKGGLRRIEVPADLGYAEGKNEIPVDEVFFVDIELLEFR